MPPADAEKQPTAAERQTFIDWVGTVKLFATLKAGEKTLRREVRPYTRVWQEANIGSRVHPWGVDSPDQVPAYVQCWRHAATALKAGGPAISVEWTNAKKTQNRALHVLGTGPGDPGMYPGDDVVDHWGTHYYDAWPLKNTQALWEGSDSASGGGATSMGGLASMAATYRSPTISRSIARCGTTLRSSWIGSKLVPASAADCPRQWIPRSASGTATWL